MDLGGVIPGFRDTIERDNAKTLVNIKEGNCRLALE
jgi:hypothetical protein